MTPRARRTVVYVVLVALGCVGLLRTQQAIWDVDALVSDQAADARVDEARRCVASWVGRDDSRNMAEATYRRNAETLLSFASSADPERLDAYRRQVEADVTEIRAELPDPDCDLDHARRVVANAKE